MQAAIFYLIAIIKTKAVSSFELTPGTLCYEDSLPATSLRSTRRELDIRGYAFPSPTDVFEVAILVGIPLRNGVCSRDHIAYGRRPRRLNYL